MSISDLSSSSSGIVFSSWILITKLQLTLLSEITEGFESEEELELDEDTEGSDFEFECEIGKIFNSNLDGSSSLGGIYDSFPFIAFKSVSEGSIDSPIALNLFMFSIPFTVVPLLFGIMKFLTFKLRIWCIKFEEVFIFDPFGDVQLPFVSFFKLLWFIFLLLAFIRVSKNLLFVP